MRLTNSPPSSDPFDIHAQSGNFNLTLTDTIMIFTQKQAKERISALEESITALEGELEAAIHAGDEKAATIIERDQTIAEQASKIVELEKAAADAIAKAEAEAETADAVKAESTEAVKELAEQLEESKEATAKAVVEELASIGQPAPIIKEDNEDQVDHLAVMLSLPSHERNAYYNQHKAAIRAKS